MPDFPPEPSALVKMLGDQFAEKLGGNLYKDGPGFSYDELLQFGEYVAQFLAEQATHEKQ